MSPKIVKLKTKDDCELTIHTLMDRKESPYVLLIHGIGATGHMWLGNGEKFRLPFFLQEKGFNVCMLNLRNRWNYTNHQWDLDHYVEFDIPAVVDYILKRSSSKKFHIIGHSLGGLLAKMYQTHHPSHGVASLVTLGSPGFRGKPKNGLFIASAAPFIKKLGRYLPHARLHHLPDTLLESLLAITTVPFNPSQLRQRTKFREHPWVKNYCANVSFQEARQLVSILEEGGIKCQTHGFKYLDREHLVTAPILAFAGGSDIVAPSGLIQDGLAPLSNTKKEFILLDKKNTNSSYSHHDLVLGPKAHIDIWPRIHNFLQLNW